MDDQNIKYSSRINLIKDDNSLPFSITSFKKSNTNLSNSSVNTCSLVAGYNRLNAITENEFEEPSVNQKFLQLQQDNLVNALKRSSSLQERNTSRAQSHLSSIYVPDDDNQIRETMFESKEKRVSVYFKYIFFINQINEKTFPF